MSFVLITIDSARCCVYLWYEIVEILVVYEITKPTWRSFFREMFVYNPTCFNLSAIVRDNINIIARFSEIITRVNNGKVHPRRGHEGIEWNVGIYLTFH